MAPGPEEVRAGQPLVGPAGRKWEAAKSWSTRQADKSIHIKKMNLVQCRTQRPGLTQPLVNRDPTKAEIRECAKRFLSPELKLNKNLKVIVPLGQLAFRHILGTDLKYTESLNNRVELNVADAIRNLGGTDD
jgi:uracil-DNA glycosylase family 4